MFILCRRPNYPLLIANLYWMAQRRWRNACSAPSNVILAHLRMFPANNTKKFCHNIVPSQSATGNSLNILDWLSENVSYALLMWMRPINVLFVIWIMTALCSIKCCNLPKRHLREKKVVILTHALNFLFAFVIKPNQKVINNVRRYACLSH